MAKFKPRIETYALTDSEFTVVIALVSLLPSNLFAAGQRRIQRRRGFSSWKSPGRNTRALPPPNPCRYRHQNKSSRAGFQNRSAGWETACGVFLSSPLRGLCFAECAENPQGI